MVNPFRKAHGPVVVSRQEDGGEGPYMLMVGPAPLRDLREAMGRGEVFILGKSHRLTGDQPREAQDLFMSAMQKRALTPLPNIGELPFEHIGLLRYDQQNMAAALVGGGDPEPFRQDLAQLYTIVGMDKKCADRDLAALKQERAQQLMARQGLTQAAGGRTP